MRQLLKLAVIALVLSIGAGIATLANTSTAAAQSSAMDELAVWNSVKESSDPAEFKVYLQKFPNGMFADVARARFLKAGGSKAELATITPAAQPAVAQTPEPKPAAAAEPEPVKQATTVAKKKKTVATKKSTKKVASKRASPKKVAKNHKATVRTAAAKPRVIRRISSNRGPIARLTRQIKKKPTSRTAVYRPVQESGGGSGSGSAGGKGGGGGGGGGPGGGWGN